MHGGSEPNRGTNVSKPKHSRSRKQSKISQAPSVESFGSLNKYIQGRELYLLLFLTISVVIVVLKDYLLLNKVYLFKDIGSDSITTFYPRYVHLADYLRSEGFPRWSFNFGMGENILPFSVGDLFSDILYFLGREALPYGIVYNEVLKIVFGGVFFFLYLKTMGLSKYSCVVGGLLFSFTGYMILGGSGWFATTSTEAFWAAVLLFSFEKLLKEGKWYFLPITIAFIASFHPFYLYLSGMFLLVYAVFRYTDEKEFQLKGLSSFLAQLGGLAVLGVAISIVFSLAIVEQMLQSPRVGGKESLFRLLSSQPIFNLAPSMEYVAVLMRTFSNDLMGRGSYFKGWYNYLESPLLYCGLVCLLLAPQSFFLVEGKRRKIFALMALVCVVPLIFPYFRYLFWGFTGDYFRAFSYFIALVLLFLSIQSLSQIDRGQKVNVIVLLGSLAVALLVLYAPYGEKERVIDADLRSAISVFIVVHALLILLMRSRQYKLFAQVGLLLVVCIEAAYLSSITVNKRDVVTSDELRKKIGYNDYTNDAVAFLDSVDRSFFRVNKDYFSGPAIHASLNDGMIQKFKGTTSYSSFNQKYYIRFLQGMNIIREGDEGGTRWAPGLGNRPLLLSLASVKYGLTKGQQSAWLGQGYEYLKTVGDVHILRNRFYLPLGFGYERYIRASDFGKLSPAQKDRIIQKSVVLGDEVRDDLGELQRFFPFDTASSYSFNEYEKDLSTLRKDTLSISEHNQNLIRGSITVERSKLLFFSIPYDRGWSAKVDGKKVDILLANIGFVGVLINKGEHKVELDFDPPYLLPGVLVSLGSLASYVFFFLRSRNKKPEGLHDLSQKPQVIS